jgi:TPR repeat protein
MLQEGKDVPADLARAVPLLEHACELDNKWGCEGLGLALARGAGTKKDTPRAALALRGACNFPNDPGSTTWFPVSCATLGRLYLEGDGVPRDFAQALALFGRACDRGGGLGCYELGVLLHHGAGVPLDKAKGEAFLDRACPAKLGDFDRSACALVEKECEGDAPRTCLGVALATVDDEARAAKLHQRACEAGLAEGCLEAGRKYEDGGTKWQRDTKLAPVDTRLAKSLYERGCELDPKSKACYRALQMDEKACQSEGSDPRERADSCLQAGRRLESSTRGYGDSDLYLASQRYKLACSLDTHGPACGELKRLCEWAPGARKWMAVQAACPDPR